MLLSLPFLHAFCEPQGQAKRQRGYDQSESVPLKNTDGECRHAGFFQPVRYSFQHHFVLFSTVPICLCVVELFCGLSPRGLSHLTPNLPPDSRPRTCGTTRTCLPFVEDRMVNYLPQVKSCGKIFFKKIGDQRAACGKKFFVGSFTIPAQPDSRAGAAPVRDFSQVLGTWHKNPQGVGAMPCFQRSLHST